MDAAVRKAHLERAAALLADDPAAAEREAQYVAEALPGDPNAGLILGSALRRQGRAGAAIARLEALVKAFPNAHPAHYELGMALADAGQSDRAVRALEAAVKLAPHNADAWRALGSLMFEAGHTRAATKAYDHYHLAMVRDPRLRPAAVALYSGRLAEAEALLSQFLAAEAGNGAAHALMGETMTRLGRHLEAGASLERALELNPADDEVRLRLARSLSLQGRSVEALPHLERLLAAEPTNPGYRSLMATVVGQTGDFDHSVAIYEELLAGNERNATTWSHYGHALRIVGRGEDAALAFRRATTLDPTLTDAYLGFANLKVAAFTADEVAAMRGLKDGSDLPAGDRESLAFALGEALEDAGDFAGAFESYAEGAASVRARLGYNPEAFGEFVRRSITVFDEAFFAERKGFGLAAPDPIFIVGLPRSGSTLMEQILASHPAIEATFELPVIGLTAWNMDGYPEGAGKISAEEARLLGESYLYETEPLRRLGRPFFIDKMPNNFQFVSLIQLILPNAKIIDARRHPMAACFSSFKQKFADGARFSYGLTDLGFFYQGYLALMRHYDRVLPGRVLKVVYEDLVAETEREVRRVLDYLGLEFDPACLEFHETQRPIRTVSSEQVRRPIYRAGLEQWRNFEPWLGPLQEALGPAMETWRD